ncbi:MULTISPECIES: copper-binding protein [unclassified Phenylobacterium]|jgi:Cu/Ag efflux protein CusF|uniref:copper-binding protein n=1 Tax=unclassified Phenylobacterium TaxID=2640670 RepID=UPI00083A2598|nr:MULTISPECIES: copper-binding protein [unclassified Phenylobacterium]
MTIADHASTRARRLVVLAAMVLLSGCDRQVVDRTPDALDHKRVMAADPTHGAPPGPIVVEAGREEGRARVVAVDPAAGVIFLRHEQSSAGDWPDLTMSFRARRAILQRVRAGDEVAFTLLVTDGVGEVATLSRR